MTCVTNTSLFIFDFIESETYFTRVIGLGDHDKSLRRVKLAQYKSTARTLTRHYSVPAYNTKKTTPAPGAPATPILVYAQYYQHDPPKKSHPIFRPERPA